MFLIYLKIYDWNLGILGRGVSRGNSAYGKRWNCVTVQTYVTQTFSYYYLRQED